MTMNTSPCLIPPVSQHGRRASSGWRLAAVRPCQQVAGLAQFPERTDDLRSVMGRLEEQYILRALKEHHNNRTRTAKTLGISRQALTTKLNKYGIIGAGTSGLMRNPLEDDLK